METSITNNSLFKPETEVKNGSRFVRILTRLYLGVMQKK